MSGDPYDHYFYEGTDTFKNMLGIINAEELRVFEYEWSRSNASEALRLARTALTLDSTVLKQVHHILLGDIYPWAGQYRTMALFKEQTQFRAIVSDESVDAVFAKFSASANIDRAHMGKCAGHLARLWGGLNHEHPFVEGNGRATQVLVTVAAERLSWEVDWAKLKRVDELDAAIRSCMVALGDNRFNGYHDVLMRIMVPGQGLAPRHDDLRPEK